MQSKIKEIYMGKSGFIGSVKLSEAYSEAAGTVSKMTEEYMKNFSEEERRKFMDFCDAFNMMEAENALTHYREGVKLGLLLVFECLSE